MSYNKAKEEYKWKRWKEKEEVQLRKCGMDETSIEERRCSDREDLKSNRRFKEHHIPFSGNPDKEYLIMDVHELNGIQALLDAISDERLLQILLVTDNKTLQILFLKIIGYSTIEISKKLEMSEKSVYCRMERLKKKIKKIL